MRSSRFDRRTRVLLFTNSVAMGGMEEHVRLLAAGLDRTRFSVVGVTPEDANVAQFASAMGAACEEFATITPDRRHGLRGPLIEAFRLIRFVRRQRVDVAHLHSTTFGGLWLATVACRLGGARRVFVTEHLAPYADISPWRRRERALYACLVTGLIAVSEVNRAERARRIPVRDGKVTVVANGIDVCRYDDVPRSEVAAVRTRYALDQAVVVGTAVRLEPGKGLHDLVRAFALLAPDAPDARLLVVGDGTLRGELEALAGALGIARLVVFAGFHADPRPYLGAMDVFVLPVPAGSASIGLLEAMAMGLPAVITFGSEAEAVQPGVSGWWAKPNDPEDLAGRIEALVRDGAARRSMGIAARERVRRDFSAERVAAELGERYTS